MRLTLKQAGGRLAVATLVATLASSLAVGADPPTGDAQSAAGTPAAKTVPAKWPASKKSAGAAGKFTLVSPDIGKDNPIGLDQVFNGFGCKGKNLSPALFWSGAPAGTQSFAIMVHDPDAPTGSGFWHWVIIDIPPTVTSLPKNAGDPTAKSLPAGAVMSRTDLGVPGYTGPCPPKGDAPHHYNFQLFAVDVDKLDADENATAAVVGFNLHFHTLAKATQTGVWGR